ncbi:unnamed protein product [Vicia faba]|uniref:Uncharacterized protein n=1 Tax=Vicia faba TaxID=3906 RepID=A0AAV0ZSG1_VICFA|nr:unnamed protein product [Vicia faba]
MASRFRSFSQPAFSLIKSTISKPKSSSPFLLRTRTPVTVRSVAELGCVQSLLPVCFAVPTPEFDFSDTFYLLLYLNGSWHTAIIDLEEIIVTGIEYVDVKRLGSRM